MRRKSIANRITLYIAVMALAICVFLGIISVYTSNQSMLKLMEEELLSLSQLQSDKVNIIVDNRIQVLQELANRARTQTMDFAVQKSSLAPDIERLGYLDMAIVTPDGMASYILEDKTADLSDRSYVQAALKGEGNVSDVIISKVTNSAVLMYAVPIYNEGNIVGALIARRDGNSLYEAIMDMGYGTNGYVYIINKAGVVVAHPNRDYVMTQLNPIEATKEDPSYKSLATAFSEILNKKSGTIQYNFNKESIYAAYTPIEGTVWTIVTATDEEEVFAVVNQLIIRILISILIVLLVSLVFSRFLGVMLSKPIIRLTKLINKYAELDFTVDQSETIKHMKADEIGVMVTSVNTMSKNIREFITRVSETTEAVSATSEELSATSQQSASASEEVANAVGKIAEGAVEQTDNSKQAVKALDLLSTEIIQNKSRTNELKNATEKIDTYINNGLGTVQDLFVKNTANGEAIHTVNDSIMKTNKSANKITEVTAMIMGVSEQTNLLALNASIEAARAGENGRGFSVVAEEIRKLAEQSRSMTNDIQLIVEELRKDAQESVGQMQIANEMVVQQEKSVELTKSAFQQIADAIEQSAGHVQKILSSGDSMEVRKEEVTRIIEMLTAVTMENASVAEEVSAATEEQSASAEEISNASEDLSRMALELQDLLRQFKI